MIINTEKMKFYNCGLGLLKFLAALEVVWIHFGKGGWGHRLAVPVFMFCSFYLLSQHKQFSLYNRLKRIAIPFWFWGGVYCFLRCIIEQKIDIIRIIYQLTLGSTYCSPLYFMMLMALFTVLIVAIKKTYILVIIAIISAISQYTGLNYNIFKSYPFPIAYSIGRFAELIPLAILGFIYGTYRNSLKLKEHILIALLCFIISFLLTILHLGIVKHGFGYSGFALLCGACFISIVCIYVGNYSYLIPDKWICYQKILYNTSSTIYYIHIGVGILISNFVKSPSISAGWLVIIFSLIFSLLLQRIKALKIIL